MMLTHSVSDRAAMPTNALRIVGTHVHLDLGVRAADRQQVPATTWTPAPVTGSVSWSGVTRSGRMIHGFRTSRTACRAGGSAPPRRIRARCAACNPSRRRLRSWRARFTIVTSFYRRSRSRASRRLGVVPESVLYPAGNSTVAWCAVSSSLSGWWRAAQRVSPQRRRNRGNRVHGPLRAAVVTAQRLSAASGAIRARGPSDRGSAVP